MCVRGNCYDCFGIGMGKVGLDIGTVRIGVRWEKMNETKQPKSRRRCETYKFLDRIYVQALDIEPPLLFAGIPISHAPSIPTLYPHPTK